MGDFTQITIQKGQGLTQALKKYAEKAGFSFSGGSISKQEWQKTIKVLDQIQAERSKSNKGSIFGNGYEVQTGQKIEFSESESKRLWDAMGVLNNASSSGKPSAGGHVNNNTPVANNSVKPNKTTNPSHTTKPANNTHTTNNSVKPNNTVKPSHTTKPTKNTNTTKVTNNTTKPVHQQPSKPVSTKQLVKSLHDDIYAKTKWGLPTTGKDIGKHISQINKNNVDSVCKQYEQQNGESLMEAVLSERGLPPEERAKYLKHISNAMLSSAKSKGVYVDDLSKDFNKEIDYQMKKSGLASAAFLNSFESKLKDRMEVKDIDRSITRPNGKIDQNFSQGHTGDCWLISSIQAVAQTPKGRQILNNSLRVDKAGNTYVTLKGANKTYKITPKELNGATNFSTGDGDVRAIEIAMDRYFKEERGVRLRNDLNGNHPQVAFRLLTGKGGRNFFSDSYGRLTEMWFSDSQINNFNKPNHIAVVFKSSGKNVSFSSPKNGEKVTLHSSHAYTVKGSDKSNVYLINPWDTSKTIAVPRKTFKEFFNGIDEFDL